MLPDEYYSSFKSFYKTLVLQSTFDMGSILNLVNLSKEKPDYENYIYYIMQGFTIMIRKLDHIEDQVKKNKAPSGVKITTYTYCFILWALHFILINHQPSKTTEKCSHSASDFEAREECKYCTVEYKKTLKNKMVVKFMKAIIPSKKKAWEVLEATKKKLNEVLANSNFKTTKKAKSNKVSTEGNGKGNDEENKKQQMTHEKEGLPFSTVVFVETVQIFLHDLCYMIPQGADTK